MLDIVEVEIDEEALIKCPVRDFEYTRASTSCVQCAGYNGISQIVHVSGDNKDELETFDAMPWYQKYVIRCGGIVERRTSIIKVVD